MHADKLSVQGSCHSANRSATCFEGKLRAHAAAGSPHVKWLMRCRQHGDGGTGRRRVSSCGHRGGGECGWRSCGATQCRAWGGGKLSGRASGKAPEADAPKLEPEPSAAGGVRENDAEMRDAEPLSAGLEQHTVSGGHGAGDNALQGVATAVQTAALQQQPLVREEGAADALCRHTAALPPVLECEQTDGDRAQTHAS